MDARYAAIGIPEPDGDEFAQFITVGMSDELIAELGPLPRTHGLLDAMLVDPSPYRTPDITQDPRFRGWWPDAHPEMRSFLGVPIVSAGDIVGAFYLTDKEGAPEFSAADEDAVVLLSSHAAIAIDQARLFEDSRELALVQERARLARELHDAMSQSLFSLQLAAETAHLTLFWLLAVLVAVHVGAALRHASTLLARESAAHRLLLLLSDGKPNDVDQYEGRYGIEDARQAIAEARLQQIHPHCLTIDRQAPAYARRIFGPTGFSVLHDPTRLPEALVRVVQQLITA